VVLNNRIEVQRSLSYGGLRFGQFSAAIASQGAAYFDREALAFI